MTAGWQHAVAYSHAHCERWIFVGVTRQWWWMLCCFVLPCSKYMKSCNADVALALNAEILLPPSW